MVWEKENKEVKIWWEEQFGITREDAEKLVDFNWEKAFDLDYITKFYFDHLKPCE